MPSSDASVDVLPAMPADGLGLPGLVQVDDGSFELDQCCQHGVLCLSSLVMGSPSSREDESALPEHLLDAWSDLDERESIIGLDGIVIKKC